MSIWGGSLSHMAMEQTNIANLYGAYVKAIKSLALLALPFAAMNATMANAAPALTPEQTFDLYARTFIQIDPEAAKALNDGLRPAFGGQDMLDFEALSAASAAAAEAEGANKALKSTLQHTECRARGSELHDNPSLADKKIATVSYVCRVPNLSAMRSAYEAMKKHPSELSRKQFDEAYAVAIAGPRTQTVFGTMDFYPGKGPDQYWFNGGGGMDDVLHKLFDAMAPFDRWDEEIAGQHAPKITGVPVCDRFLAQHRACVSKLDASQLPGVDAMVAELKGMASQTSAEALAQRCTSLRSVAKLMWTDGCDL